MATIHVDGKEYEVNGADNLLEACLSLGLDIPYFCWHPALGSVGACRQCAVKQYQNAEDTRGRLVMSCMTRASVGTFISIDDEEAKQFRERERRCLPPVCGEAISERGRHAWSPGDVLYDSGIRRHLYFYRRQRSEAVPRKRGGVVDD